MNGKILILNILFLLPAIGCHGHTKNEIMTGRTTNDQEKKLLYYKNEVIDSVSLRYRNEEKYQALISDRNPFSLTVEELQRQYKYYSVDKKEWILILHSLETATYVEEQYDVEKNPDGFMKKVPEQDYTLTIHYSDHTKQENICIWDNGNITISGKWHRLLPEHHSLLFTMLRDYTSGNGL